MQERQAFYEVGVSEPVEAVHAHAQQLQGRSLSFDRLLAMVQWSAIYAVHMWYMP